jgi:dihydrofolate synthase/folylpolyglutamate synthase
MNYEEALNYIHAVQWAGHKPGLTRTRTLLAALGNPHKQLKFIHVAGTNGKGSTAAMLASCLQAAVTGWACIPRPLSTGSTSAFR